MFRTRQPLRKYIGAPLTHSEVRAGKNGELERVDISDCDKLPPVEDFDLDLNIRAGENLKEVSSVLMNHGTVNVTYKENTQKTDSSVKDESNEE